MNKPVPPLTSGARPLIRHLLQFKNYRTKLFRKGLAEKGGVFAIQIGPQKAAVLIGPDHQQTFFMETDKKLSMNKSYSFLKAMFGEILFTASPEVYQKQRPVIHGPFKREKMLTYTRIMQEQVQKWLDALLFQQFDVKLVTREVETVFSMGVARPSPAIVRYKRKLTLPGTDQYLYEKLEAQTNE